MRISGWLPHDKRRCGTQTHVRAQCEALIFFLRFFCIFLGRNFADLCTSENGNGNGDNSVAFSRYFSQNDRFVFNDPQSRTNDVDFLSPLQLPCSSPAGRRLIFPLYHFVSAIIFRFNSHRSSSHISQASARSQNVSVWTRGAKSKVPESGEAILSTREGVFREEMKVRAHVLR